jgi:hypothetical protein
VRAPAQDLLAIWNDPARLYSWTLEQLQLTELDEVPWIYPVNHADRHSPHRWHLESREIKAFVRDGLERCLRDDPELYLRIVRRSEFLQELMRKRPRGRPPGHEPGLAEALDDIARIRKLWRRTFKKTNRSAFPTAIDIAAARHSFTSDQLVHFRKNRPL